MIKNNGDISVDKALWRARVLVHDSLGDLSRAVAQVPDRATGTLALLHNANNALTEALGLLDSFTPSPRIGELDDAELILRIERAARRAETDYEARGELLARMNDLRGLANAHQRWE